MSRADRARDIAARAAFGGGGLAAAGLVGVGVLRLEAQVARRLIGDGPGISQDDDGTYGAGVGDAFRILMMGDSTASGVGADAAGDTIGATVATGVAALTGRPVLLRNVSRSGATALELPAQVHRGLEVLVDPQVALIMIGTNDVKDRVDQAESVRALSEAVRSLRAADIEVVVGTCPDLGTIRPVPQPLRWLSRRWSRDLAAAQTVAVVEAGGRTVSTGDLLGPVFRQMPLEMFSDDRFHPSSAGYARAAAVMLPSVCDALGLPTLDSGRAPDHRRGEAVEPLSAAAERAAADPGSEVSGAEVDGHTRGARGRWAQLLRRQRPVEQGPEETGQDEEPPAPRDEPTDPQVSQAGESVDAATGDSAGESVDASTGASVGEPVDASATGQRPGSE